MNVLRSTSSWTVCRGISSALFVVALVCTHVDAAQETTGSIRGRASAADGAPIAGARVVARSANLTPHRETQTSRDGRFLLAFLPPGDYVVTFERDGFVTVKHTARLSSHETVVADVVLPPAKEPEPSIVVVIHPESLSPPVGASEVYGHDLLDGLPLGGGLLSASVMAAGPIGTQTDDALLVLDGAPARFAGHAQSPPLLDPGPAVIEEVALVDAGVPAAVGRLQSGMISVVTRTGGERLSGEIRQTFGNADSQADVLESASASDGLASLTDFRVGLPLQDQRSWLFAAGRRRAERLASHAPMSDALFPSRIRDQFWQLKAAHALSGSHRLQALLATGLRDSTDVRPVDAVFVEDVAALEDRRTSHRLVSADYAGLLGEGLHITARLTGERLATEVEGDDQPSLAARTAVKDQQTGALIGSPGGCATCDPEALSSMTWRFAASRLLPSFPTHLIGVGYEGSLGRLDPPSAPVEGSFELRASRFRPAGSGIVPVLETNSSTWILWRPPGDNRLTYGSDGFFLSDDWRPGATLSVHAGLRWDRHRLSRFDTAERILTESAFSPRVYVSWRPSNDEGWTLTSGYARYAVDLPHRLDPRIGGPAERAFPYLGPPINAAEVADAPTQEVVERALAWFFANGGVSRTPALAFEPGLGALRPGVRSTPHLSEWTLGAGHILGGARVRADFIWRQAESSREWRVDPHANPSMDRYGQAIDQAIPSDADVFARKYAALAIQFHYRLGIQAVVGGLYTLSRSWGTDDVPSVVQEPASSAAFAYREYFDPAWAAPGGDLSDDRRHRLKFWGHMNVFENESRGTLGVGLLQSIESGQPYGLVSLIDAAPFVVNPGYRQAPLAVPYYFTARDHFSSKSAIRTDVAATYTRILPGTVRTTLVVEFEVLNVFDKERLLRPETYVVARTAYTEPSRFAPFNPLADAPVQGVHWDLESLADPSDDDAGMTMPRAFRVSAGVRF